MYLNQQQYEQIEEKKWHHHTAYFIWVHRFNILAFKIVILLIIFILLIVGSMTMQDLTDI